MEVPGRGAYGYTPAGDPYGGMTEGGPHGYGETPDQRDLRLDFEEALAGFGLDVAGISKWRLSCHRVYTLCIRHLQHAHRL
jgi:hypothetical protein